MARPTPHRCPADLASLVRLAAAYVSPNHFKARLGHPMLPALMLWALAHLLVSGWLHSILVFGSFLLWALLCFQAARRREPASRATEARSGAPH